MDDITVNFVTAFDQSTNLFESICGKKSAGWMIKIYKKILMECSV